MNTITISKKKYGRLLKAGKERVTSKTVKDTGFLGTTKIPISFKGILKGITVTGKDIAEARKSLFKAG